MKEQITDPIDESLARIVCLSALFGNKDGQTEEQLDKVLDRVREWGINANLWCLIKDGLICICVMDEEIVIRAATAVERDQMLSAGRESRR
jgi:hypothetical protein